MRLPICTIIVLWPVDNCAPWPYGVKERFQMKRNRANCEGVREKLLDPRNERVRIIGWKHRIIAMVEGNVL